MTKILGSKIVDPTTQDFFKRKLNIDITLLSKLLSQGTYPLVKTGDLVGGLGLYFGEESASERHVVWLDQTFVNRANATEVSHILLRVIALYGDNVENHNLIKGPMSYDQQWWPNEGWGAEFAAFGNTIGVPSDEIKRGTRR